jgi:hypothetical protein
MMLLAYLLRLEFRKRRFQVIGDSSRLSLQFHSVKERQSDDMEEVAESVGPESTAVDANVLYLQSTVVFPSWTSRAGSASGPASRFMPIRSGLQLHSDRSCELRAVVCVWPTGRSLKTQMGLKRISVSAACHLIPLGRESPALLDASALGTFLQGPGYCPQPEAQLPRDLAQ